MQQMRMSDAFLLVLKNFDDGMPGDPVADFHSIFQDFILADMIHIENRLDRIGKQNRRKEASGLDQEAATLQQCLHHLDQGEPLSTLPLLQSDGKSLRGFQFLSQKPLMVVINCAEAMTGSTPADNTRRSLPDSVPVIAACLKLEAELAGMEPEEQAAFMAEYGVAESLTGRLIRLAYQTLGLISFLTVGGDECRAWPIRRGVCAQEAASTIHTDLSDRFIRAETVSYEDFMRYGDMAGCKKAGVWRLEGKQYVVRDGDILSIRAGN
jgi:ribosome-binding ATPase YchF (GTP1/OBG family)